MANAIENGAEFGCGGKAQGPFAEVGSSYDLGLENRRSIVCRGKVQAFARLYLAAGTHQSGPLVLVELLGQKNFNAPCRIR